MSDKTSISVFIDGRPITPEEIGPPAMNYGQLHRWKGYRQLTYRYEAPLTVFWKRVNPWFEQYRSETRVDDLNFSPGRDTAEAAFAALGYPALKTMLSGHKELASQLLKASPLELNNLFDFSSPNTARYSANSVDFLDIDDNHARFGGVAFDIGSKDR